MALRKGIKDAADRGEAKMSASMMVRLTGTVYWYDLKVGDVWLLAFRDIGPPKLNVF